METKESGRRYFVTIHAQSVEALRALRSMRLDIFRSSAIRAAVGLRVAQAEAGGPAAQAAVPPPGVEGLLGIEEIERLVHDGYRVTIEEEASRRARARAQVVEFDVWVKGMEG